MGRDRAFDIKSRLVTRIDWVKGAHRLKARGWPAELRL